MGPGRRMKKQGPPASLEELGINLKRKLIENSAQNESAKRRRTSDDEDDTLDPTSPKKLVKLDRAMRQERLEIREKRLKRRAARLINNDAQITVPPRSWRRTVKGKNKEMMKCSYQMKFRVMVALRKR